MTDHGTRDPSLAPAVEGLHWARGGLDSLPLSSVLSIVELTFKAGIDIRDDSKPAGKLWKATLEYMLTLPGLESLFWGLSVESSGSVYLLLQWGSPVGWQTFQKSFGIGLVVGLLASPPFNRALRLRVDLCSAKTSYLDAFSFPFHARISTQEKKTIEDAVSKSLSLVVETSSAEAWLQWLELDVPANPRSEIAPGKAAEQSHVLVVLLARRSLQDRSLEVDILPLDVLAGTATKVTLGLIQERPRLSSKPTFQPLAGQSTEALFKLLPHRQYSQDSDLFRQKDVIASGSNSKYQQSLRAFPAPYGSYEPMGHLNQYSTLNEGEPHDSSNRKRLLMVVEVCWLQFKPGCININSSNQDGSAMKEFLDLGAEIARHSECEGVSWGSEEGSPDTLVMFISWKTFKTGMNTFNTFSNTVTTERFTSRFPNLATPPQVQRFPSSFVPDGSSLMELTSFYVPSEHLTKMLFEEAYAKFQSTRTFPATFSGDRFASSSLHWEFGGWEIDGPFFARDGGEALRFAGAVIWNKKVSTASRWWAEADKAEKTCTSQEARAQWYQDFADGMESYERLGKYVDALQALIASSGSVESRFVVDVQRITKK